MAETFFVYVLQSGKTGRRYTGSCQDVTDRLRRHNAGESKSTEHGLPWKLVYYETVGSRADAVQREKYFKTGQGRKELDRVLSNSGSRVQFAHIEVPG